MQCGMEGEEMGAASFALFPASLTDGAQRIFFSGAERGFLLSF